MTHDFDKYDGLTWPKVHTQYYLVKMAPQAKNVPLMNRTFLESLTGIAVIHHEEDELIGDMGGLIYRLPPTIKI